MELPDSMDGSETFMSKGENSRSAMAGNESLPVIPSSIVSIPLCIMGADVDVSSGISTISSNGNALSSAGPDALRRIGHSSPIVCGVAGIMLNVGRCSSSSSSPA
jgi:hypothetical protein